MDVEHAEIMVQAAPEARRMPSGSSFWTSVCLLVVGAANLAAAETEPPDHLKIATYRHSEIRNRVQDHGLAMFFAPAEKREEYKTLRQRESALKAAILQDPRPSAYKEQLFKDMEEAALVQKKLDLFHQTFSWEAYAEGRGQMLDYLRRNYLKRYSLILEEETWKTINARGSESIVGDVEVTDITSEITKTMLEAIGGSDTETAD